MVSRSLSRSIACARIYVTPSDGVNRGGETGACLRWERSRRIFLWVSYTQRRSTASDEYQCAGPILSISYPFGGFSLAEPALVRSGGNFVRSAGPRSPARARRLSMLDVLMLVLGLAGFGLMLGYAAICTRL
jgi:hypothetical protein